MKYLGIKGMRSAIYSEIVERKGSGRGEEITNEVDF